MKLSKKILAPVTLVALISLSACGSGSGSTNSPSLPKAPVATAPVTIVIPIPKKTASTASIASNARKALFVSPSSSQGTILLNGVTSIPMVYTIVMPPGQSTLSATFNAPLGSDTFKVSLTDGNMVVGKLLSEGTATATVLAAPAVNNVIVTCDGVPATALFVPATTTGFTIGTASTIQVGYTLKDADNNVIPSPSSQYPTNPYAVYMVVGAAYNADVSFFPSFVIPGPSDAVTVEPLQYDGVTVPVGTATVALMAHANGRFPSDNQLATLNVPMTTAVTANAPVNIGVK